MPATLPQPPLEAPEPLPPAPEPLSSPEAEVQVTVPLLVGVRPSRASRSALAVLAALSALAVLCCGAAVAILRFA
ncbi:hypothetical protein [Actinoplanes awajinensis]|uniref:Uncharacterized protein n=1 Tax=Actinoplanes awajinensis subsp. mycoplanecinus TaxID=135947 RepID=A0A0X3VD24_9ACTN|nr:hypothetical protein [Actinoplanes awajinensis]KUL42172.1 hypothetical protein ADL15_02010 [Actinoplanes awajinensis subsp. mycoplanecinus]